MVTEFRVEKVTNGFYIWYMDHLDVRKEVFVDRSVLIERLEVLCQDMEER